MRHHPPTNRLVAALACAGLLAGNVHAIEGSSGAAPAGESLERGGRPPLEGRLAFDPADGFTFHPVAGSKEGPLALDTGTVVDFPSREFQASSLLPLFQVMAGETARISGQLRAIREGAVTLAVPWQSAEVSFARPGVQAVTQRPGEARIFIEEFERLDPKRWTSTGTLERITAPRGGTQAGGVRLPASGASLLRHLDEPLLAGRLELSFDDDARVVAGRRWRLEMTFRGPAGSATVRVILGWDEESLAVESLDGPSLSVQRLARNPGPHRLAIRFGPEQIEVSVDAKELAYGKGPAGPLETIRIVSSSTAPGDPPAGLAAVVREVQLVRFAEPSASLEIDPSQDEARLVVGDQLYGTIRGASGDRVVIDVDGRTIPLDWGEVAGLYFRREPAPGIPVEGYQARVEWRAWSGNAPRDVDFAEGAVTNLTDSALTMSTAYAGTLSIPRDRLVRLRVLDPGRFQVIDPCSHHLGDNISVTPPLLDPPLFEGGVLERSFEVKDLATAPGFLMLDVVQVVGETAGGPFSSLVQKGELRTNVSINGKPMDYLNRYVTTSNETTERIRIPIRPGLLVPGRNVLRIEQTGTKISPQELDDLGILQIGLLSAMPADPAARPGPGSPERRGRDEP